MCQQGEAGHLWLCRWIVPFSSLKGFMIKFVLLNSTRSWSCLNLKTGLDFQLNNMENEIQNSRVSSNFSSFFLDFSVLEQCEKWKSKFKIFRKQWKCIFFINFNFRSFHLKFSSFFLIFQCWNSVKNEILWRKTKPKRHFSKFFNIHLVCWSH